MGATAIRITATDFLTPPELRNWRLASSEAGRIGGVRLELLADGARTRLGSCYQQVPLRVLPPFRFGDDRPALIYLLNPTAGLMDGDAQLVDITARAGSRTIVVGQSATRIHPAVSGFSTQQWHLRVATGALLVILPGLTIPFQGCRYYQRVNVDLAPGAGFIWGDIWLAGRYARGDASECFQFNTMIQELTVQRGQRLIFRDRFCWRGPWDVATADWHFGKSVACGSVFATGADEMHKSESGPSQPAVFRTAFGDTCRRWCGPSELVTTAVVQTALRLAAALTGKVDGSWLLGPDLAPSHWFSLALERASVRPGN
jgi:urease accessory protein